MQEAVPKPIEIVTLHHLVERFCPRAGTAPPPVRDRAGPDEWRRAIHRRLATMLLSAAREEQGGATGDELCFALLDASTSARRCGDAQFAAVASGFVRAFEVARSAQDLATLARHAIAQLSPLGLKLPIPDGELPWLGSSSSMTTQSRRGL
jgi:hypothetical protein